MSSKEPPPEARALWPWDVEPQWGSGLWKRRDCRCPTLRARSTCVGRADGSDMGDLRTGGSGEREAESPQSFCWNPAPVLRVALPLLLPTARPVDATPGAPSCTCTFPLSHTHTSPCRCNGISVWLTHPTSSPCLLQGEGPQAAVCPVS